MDAIDATDRSVRVAAVAPPSLLTIIIDTSPASWARLAHKLPFHSVIQTLLVFTNAHLAMNHSNQVAVLASHVDRVEWLYPTSQFTKATEVSETNGVKGTHSHGSHKYRPFHVVEEHVRQNLKKLLDNTPDTSSALSSPPLLSGALSMALAHANMQKLLAAPAASLDSAEDKVAAPGAADLDAHTTAVRNTMSSIALTARILVISVSEADISSQYVGLMNAVFAAQRMNIPIDILRIGPRAAFLQQASDATNGVFLSYDPADTQGSTVNGHDDMEEDEMDDKQSTENAAAMGLLQTLMMGYLPDVTARKSLVMPGSDEVDFRAACFCHGKIVDLGGVCSVCLSIFCLPLPMDDNKCPTCQSTLRIPKSLFTKPAVLPKKKKKKKKPGDISGMDTPGLASGGNTPSRAPVA